MLVRYAFQQVLIVFEVSAMDLWVFALVCGFKGVCGARHEELIVAEGLCGSSALDGGFMLVLRCASAGTHCPREDLQVLHRRATEWRRRPLLSCRLQPPDLCFSFR